MQFLLDATVDAVVAVDETGRIASCNRAAGRLLGLREEECVGRPVQDVFVAADDTGVLDRALSGVEVTSARTAIVREDGTDVPVRIEATSEDHEIVLVIHDESEHVETQAALADVQERLRDLQSLGNVGLWRWVPATDELQWSAQLYSIHGIDPLDFEGTLAGHVAPTREDDRDDVRNGLLEAVEEGYPFEAEYVIVRGDGEERCLYSRADPVLDSQGEVRALTGIVQDVTADRRARAEVEAANARLERFASVLAHDLRGPLTTTVGFADLLIENANPAGEVAEFARHIKNNGERALELLNDILSEAGRRRRETTSEVELDDVVTWVVDTLAERIDATGSRILVRNLPRVQGHEALLRQALLNLVGNALKFADVNEGATVRISAVDADDVVELRVEDDGPGVPERDRDAIFEDGHRLQRDVDRGIDGTGIGLATVQEVAERHGTSVTVGDSDLGGARFSLRLAPARESSPVSASG